MHREMSFVGRTVLPAPLLVAPRVVEHLLRLADVLPYYRRIVAVTPAQAR